MEADENLRVPLPGFIPPPGGLCQKGYVHVQLDFITVIMFMCALINVLQSIFIVENPAVVLCSRARKMAPLCEIPSDSPCPQNPHSKVDDDALLKVSVATVKGELRNEASPY